MDDKSRNSILEIIYGPKLSRFIKTSTGKYLFSTEPAFLRVNRVLDRFFITVRGPENLDKIQIASCIVSSAFILILVIYIIKFIIFITGPSDSFFNFILGDIFYLLDSRNWIYLMWIIIASYSVTSRTILLAFSLQGNLNIFTDWRKESLAIYSHKNCPSVDQRLVKLERWLIFTYELCKLVSILFVTLFFIVVSMMSYLTICDLTRRNELMILSFIWWTLWTPVLVIGVTGVICPIFLAVCGVFYILYRADVCTETLKNVDMEIDGSVLLEGRTNFSLNQFSTELNQLCLAIHRQGKVFSFIFSAFITIASLSSAIITFLFFYGQSTDDKFNILMLAITSTAWFCIATLPIPVVILNDKIDLMYRKLIHIQVRCSFLSLQQKVTLHGLIELVGTKGHIISYTIFGHPYTSSFHLIFLLHVITLIFLLVDIYVGH